MAGFCFGFNPIRGSRPLEGETYGKGLVGVGGVGKVVGAAWYHVSVGER
jgi:hypothetical protein